jgi:hypothetical protein
LDVEALAESPWFGLVERSEALAAVDVAWWVSFAVCVDVAGSVSVTFVVDVAVSVDICGVRVAVPVDVTCSVRVGVSVNVTCGVMSAFAVAVAGGASTGPAVAVVTGAGVLSSGGEPVRARALLMPWPIALTRSAMTFAGLSGGISRAGVGSHGGMLRS